MRRFHPAADPPSSHPLARGIVVSRSPASGAVPGPTRATRPILAAAAAALLTASALGAQEPTKLSRVRLSYPTYTAAGTILYESMGGGNWDVFTMPEGGVSDSAPMTRLTASDSLDRMPAMSPDGRFIAFISDRNGNYDVYRMRADGTDVRRLTTTSAHEIHPYWTPDSRQIVFNRLVPEERVYAIWIMDSDGGGQRELLHDGQMNSYAQVSPDGRLLVFDKWWGNEETNGEIMVMDLDSRAVRRLTENAVYDGYPTWFPDSRHVLYSSEVDGVFKLMRIDVTSGERTQVSFGPGADQRGDVSADGTRIVFNRNIDGSIEIYELLLPPARD